MSEKLQEFISEAEKTSDFRVTDYMNVDIAGVDPLGLRQINFNLMDFIFPGINNVIRHIRPYVVMTWAWRRAGQITKKQSASDEDLRDFVDRVEVIYAWSQFLCYDDVGMPGKDILRPVINAKQYKFSGPQWEGIKKNRPYSTSLMAAVNYGPSIRSMKWLCPIEGHKRIFKLCNGLEDVLDAFERKFQSELNHPAFNRLGGVTVQQKDVKRWARMWRLSNPSKSEIKVFYERFAGRETQEAQNRAQGVELILAAKKDIQNWPESEEKQYEVLNARMSDAPDKWRSRNIRPKAADIWREVQVRQVFRLALEAFLHWSIWEIGTGALQSPALANKFLEQCRNNTLPDIEKWMTRRNPKNNPFERLMKLSSVINDDPSLAPSEILKAIGYCLSEVQHLPDRNESSNRLPLKQAYKNAESWLGCSRGEFVANIFEKWVMKQHTYWAAGRGLNDARSGNDSKLRLKIVMDENGWTLTPGARAGVPKPAQDRLKSVMRLLKECGKL